MNLYLLKQSGHVCYDEYEGAVVAAETEDDARKIHPDGSRNDRNPADRVGWCMDWESPDAVSVTLIGVAATDTREGVILASYRG